MCYVVSGWWGSLMLEQPSRDPLGLGFNGTQLLAYPSYYPCPYVVELVGSRTPRMASLACAGWHFVLGPNLSAPLSVEEPLSD